MTTEWDEQAAVALAAADEARKRMGVTEERKPAPARVDLAKLLASVVQITPEEAERQKKAADAAELRQMEMASLRRRARLAAAMKSIPARYDLWLWDEALPGRVLRKEAVKETQAALSASGLVWVGISGSGKTSLACAAARDWLDANDGTRAVFARAAQLATASRYHKLGDGQPEAILDAIRCDLLILDELGARTGGAQWTDVEDVVFARYERNVPTWVTTWMTPEKVAEQYGDGFARRIFERAAVINCGGEA